MLLFLGESFTKAPEYSEPTGVDLVPSCDAASYDQAQRAQACPKQQRAGVTLLIHGRYRENHEGDQSD